MDITYLIKVVTLIMTISVAAERLVEIVKGLFTKWTWLNTQNPDAAQESYRQLVLHLMAVAAGIGTAFLVMPVIGKTLGPEATGNEIYWAILLGVCSGGGSSFWNSILGYLTKAKDIKADASEQQKAQTIVAKAQASADLLEISAKPSVAVTPLASKLEATAKALRS